MNQDILSRAAAARATSSSKMDRSVRVCVPATCMGRDEMESGVDPLNYGSAAIAASGEFSTDLTYALFFLFFLTQRP